MKGDLYLDYIKYNDTSNDEKLQELEKLNKMIIQDLTEIKKENIKLKKYLHYIMSGKQEEEEEKEMKKV